MLYIEMAIRNTITDMKDIASHYGGKCLSKEFINSSSPLTWMCANGHTWNAPYSIISQGGWCVMCDKEKDKRLRLEKIKDIASQKGGKCLSTEYKNRKTHLDFECALGHKWHTSSFVILNGGWCPKCAGKAKPTLHELHQLAESRGGKFLSTDYVNSLSDLKWQCKEGHQWMACFRNVNSNKTWCPYCYGNVTKSIDDVRQFAKSKGGKCLSESYTNNKQILNFECNKGHIWKASAHRLITGGSWCPYCAGKMKRTIQDMQSLAKAKQGKCLSSNYINIKTKLRWQCKEKHVWMTTPDNVVAGYWCPVCAIENRKKKNQNEAKT